MDLENYTGVVGRVVTALTLGNEPSANDLKIANKMGVDVPLMRQYLKHVKEVTDVREE